MINLLTFSYKLVRADSFYIFYFFLAIGMGVIVGFFASRAFERRVWRVCMFSGVLILHVITADKVGIHFELLSLVFPFK